MPMKWASATLATLATLLSLARVRGEREKREREKGREKLWRGKMKLSPQGLHVFFGLKD
jgi:hypothetical protein